MSPLLWHKIKPGLSAGRVQSVALRIVVEREKEIRAFVPEEYWTLDAYLRGSAGEVKARYFGEQGKKAEIKDKATVDSIVKDVSGKDFLVKSVTPKERRKIAPPPFTTSTLQQEASRKLGFPVRKTMSLAQELYEGVELGKEGYTGLITYMRTDSTRISEVAVSEAKSYITSVFGAEYAGSQRKEKERPGEQGAHEAVRPSSVLRTPAEVKPYLKQDLFRLYKLIWERFVASQMAPAVYDTVTAEIDCAGHTFRASGSRLRFPGFTRVYEEGSDSPAEEDREIIPLTEGEVLKLMKLDPVSHLTEPPPRFTEASLVKALEENGIGRPSTYAPTIATLFEREYVAREGRRIYPTELGFLVDALLSEHFPAVVDLKFTAEMERKLDAVEEGEVDWTSVVREFWAPLSEQVKKVDKEVERVQVQDEPAGENCEKCGRPMVIKRGRFGRFIACSGYPECKNTKPLLEKAGVKCPLCGGELVVRRSKRGKVFYGCEKYPECGFVTWNRPVPGSVCPKCGWFLVESGTKGEQNCANPDCRYKAEKLKEN